MKKIDFSRIKVFENNTEVIFYFNPNKKYSKEYPYTGSHNTFRIYKNYENKKWYSNGIVDKPLLEESFEEIMLRRGRQNEQKFKILVENALNYVSNLKENK